MNQVIAFQFHKGSIKRYLVPKQIGHRIKFQFHKGSIKRSGKNKYFTGKTQFQFHKGSIKSESRAIIIGQVAVISIPQRFD